jgi:signal transduction histidine kinase/PleD family two-component response regulator
VSHGRVATTADGYSPRVSSRQDVLEAAIDAMADGVLVADVRTGAVVVNQAARDMLGIGAEVAVTTGWLKDALGFYPFDLALSSSGPLREELRIGARVLHSVVTPMFATGPRGGAPTGAVVVLRDLGETRDLAHRRGEFAQLMSQELRTPLTSVAGALDIVLGGYAGELSEKQHRYVDMARQAATQLNVLVDQLLDLARAQTGSITVSLAPMHLEQLARATVDRYRESARARQVHLELITPREPVPILGDSARLAQVLANLLANAIKFAPPGGRVEVTLFGPPIVPDAVGVSVFNDGAPLAEAERERIFEPFSASGRKVGGSGMGLSISRSIIEAHGGRMWAEAEGNGSKFVFTLPCKAAVMEPMSVAASTSEMMRKRRDPVQILLVDSDRHRALLIKGLLLAGGDDVTVVADVDAALAVARSVRPSLAIVASAVPDAMALVAILEHDPETRQVAVLGLADASASATMLAAGADEVLDIPVQPPALGAAIVRLLDAHRQGATRVLVVDPDPGVRLICREVLEHAGHLVRDVAPGELALAEARRLRPDLVVLDVTETGADGSDGFAMVERLRADAVAALTPFIFVSARADVADKIRAFRSGAEDYLVKPFDAAELEARVAKALARYAREVGASPTTQLPGGEAIASEIERRIEERAVGDRAAVACYLDLDNLKAFNDYYGYAKADAVIRQTGSLIRDVVSHLGDAGDFIGHIAGDDFVYLTSAAHVDAISRSICERFDQLIPLYYDRDDRGRGFIETKDRWGVARRFPIMSVSIAAVSLARVASYADLATLAAAGKQAAKVIIGSSYLRDDQLIVAPGFGEMELRRK